jgi:selenocysteine-specific elongation factor
VALNLSGQERRSVERGDVICHEKLTLTSDRFDAFVEVRPTAAAGIKNHQHVRVHVGTAERLGKLIVLGTQEKIEPKQSAYSQLTLSEPVLVLRGDRFVIRDETAQRTLGGGVVIHPWAKKHRRNEPGLDETLRALHRGDLASVVAAFVSGSDDFAVSVASQYQFLNVREEEIEERLEGLAGIRAFNFEGEKLYTTETRWREVRDALLLALREFHSARPLAPGMDIEELRDKLPYHIASRLFRAFMEQLEADKAIVRETSFVRLPEHRIRLRGEEQRVVERITALLASQPLSPPDVKQIEAEVGVSRPKVQEVLRIMERERSIVRVAPDLFFLGEAVAKVKAVLCTHLAQTNEITPGAFRDLFGTSRKYTIPLLEYFDREGITVRVGDARRLKNRSLTSR